MSIRKTLLLTVAALALLAAPAAFAADAPSAPASQEDFLLTLQAPSDDGGAAQPELDLEGEQQPELKHGSGCFISDYVCRSCSGGKLKNCYVQTCYYQGVWHDHYVNCTPCSNTCAI